MRDLKAHNARGPSPQATQPRTPFHPGEQAVQRVAGVREEAEARGQKMLTPQLVAAQREFFAQLPFIVTSHIDSEGQPWAGLIIGRPGFIMTTADGRIRIEYGSGSIIAPAPPAVFDTSYIEPGSPIGLLGIEFARRRRNRINATVEAVDTDSLTAQIDQGYGNCPKHITQRPWDADLFAGAYKTTRAATISNELAAFLKNMDTFFLASSSGPTGSSETTQRQAWGVDISHRGGEPGFVEVKGNVLSFDDYPGNNLFNTLGNLRQYPPCSLLVMDFETGTILQLAGRAELQHNGEKYCISIDVYEVRCARREL